MARRSPSGPRPARGVRGDGGGARRHLSPGTRAALARTRFIEVVPAGPSRLHSSAPPRSDEPPVVLHPMWAPAHPRRSGRTDGRGPVRRTHVLQPGAAPRRGPRPGRRARPVVPYDIPIDAFAVEVGGSAHPSVRSLGDRRLVYIEHRHAVRRAYRRRQLLLAVGLSGAFVAVAAAALSGGHAAASVPSAPAGSAGGGESATHASDGGSRALPAVALASARSFEPPMPFARRSPHESDGSGSRSPVVDAAGRFVGARTPEDRDERRKWRPIGVGRDSLANDPFLVCTRGYESIYAGGYRAVSPGGEYRGAYQFDRVTWNGIAAHLGRYDLVGVDPAAASPAAQDLLAYRLYRWQGASHWHNRCAGLR